MAYYYDASGEHEYYDGASEMQNCLTEAQMEPQDPPPEVGEGNIRVVVTVPRFCKSTDAFAGNRRIHIQRFRERSAALEWIHTEGDDGGRFPYRFDYSLQMEDKNYQPTPTPPNASNDCPF